MDDKKIIMNYWKSKRVFVTGASGFLGSWLIRSLIEQGADVIALVRDETPRSLLFLNSDHKKITIVKGELEDYFLLERILGEYQIEVIFHIGAQTQVEIANRNPISTFETNIRGTWNLLEATKRSPVVKKVLVASSDKAYGKQESLPYNESQPLHGDHPYDVSKSAADLIAQSYFSTYGTPVCITRCGNFFGGGDFNYNRLVPSVIRAALSEQRPIIRSDGTLRRDYLYIEDAVRVYMQLAEKMDDVKIHGQAFNFSVENPLSVLEMTTKILSLMNSSLTPEVLGQAKNEIADQYLSAEKARKVLGWKAQYSLDAGLEKTIAWYTKHFHENHS